MRLPVIHSWLAASLAAAMAFTAQPASALSFTDTPLFLSVSVAPNLILTLDDSGSMTYAYVPDGISGGSSTRRYKSGDFNGMYYNPATTYTAPTDASGTSLSTSFNSAYINGFDTSRGTRDLSSNYRPTSSYSPNSSSQSFASHPSADFGCTTCGVAAYYYVYDTSLASCAPSPTDDDCYRKVDVSSTSGPGGTDERQNFANWYSFYRTRNLATVSAAARAFASVASTTRVSWQALNTCNSFTSGSCSGWSGSSVDNRIEAYGSGQKSDLYTWLFRLPASGGTPLRTAMQRAGQYLQTTGVNSPYAYEPRVTQSPEYACRQSFHIMMTDGIWNSDSFSSYGNADSTATTLPDGAAYAAQGPFQDSSSNTVSDIAFYYWANDLQSGIANQLPTYTPDTSGSSTAQYWNPRNDPATWQHMVNFNVGLGLSDALNTTAGDGVYDSYPLWGGDTYSGDYSNLVSGSVSWPSASTNATPGNVYDLWHASLNSRGQFFSAESPDSLVSAMQNILSQISNRTGSAGSVASNSTSLNTGSYVFQSSFNSADWTGSVKSYSVGTDGTLAASASWDAGTQINGQSSTSSDSRVIITQGASDGIPFQWASLTAAQQTALNTNASGVSDARGSDRLGWLRGRTQHEGSGASALRQRPVSKLGDIVNSGPWHVGKPAAGYADSEHPGYAAFAGSYASRKSVVYVGANDGMLHGFDASTSGGSPGSEVLGYVPSGVYANLSWLSDQSYTGSTHKFFVDGSPFAGDADLDSSAASNWRTVLAGTFNSGAKGLFLLDVTDPSSFNEGNAASLVLAEFNDSHDTDMGHLFNHPPVNLANGQPRQIAKMENGEWALIMGNGYNSTNGHAALYILFLAGGADGTWSTSDYKKITLDSSGSNGLGTPYPHDADGDGLIDTIYAGDLKGNLWKVDTSASSAASWGIPANLSSQPLFLARDGSSNPQPIVEPPAVTPHPSGTGQLVLFGSGKYLESGDNSDTSAQTFYGVWDKGDGTRPTRSQLVQQTLTESGSSRTPSSNNVDWSTKYGWYMDLPSSGERVTGVPYLISGIIFFNTLIPSTAACSTGGSGWLMALDYDSGGVASAAIFDTNGDGKVDGLDTATGGVKNDGSVGGSTIIFGTGNGDPDAIAVYSELSGSLEAIELGLGSLSGRISWREVK
jgi:type IV pilus assembly protein PilY1